MMGLYFLVLIGGYIWIVSKIRKRVHPYWGKVLVTVIAILIPTADAIYGRIKVQLMCKAEGGLHIYRVVEDVEGFGELDGRPYEKFLKMGFKYVEGISEGQPSRMTLSENGIVNLEVGVEPISEYVVYESNFGNNKDIFSRAEKSIRVRSTGEVLSRATNISFRGGWFERFMGDTISGPSGESFTTCGRLIFTSEIIEKTLKPIQSNSTQPNSTQ